jgi:hypothetical protein
MALGARSRDGEVDRGRTGPNTGTWQYNSWKKRSMPLRKQEEVQEMLPDKNE